VQNSILRTKAYDFTALLFNSFKNNVKQKLIEQGYHMQKRLAADIIGEYISLVGYNPAPQTLELVNVDTKDTASELSPIITTVNNLSPYLYQLDDTAKTASAITKNERVDAFNNRAKIFNAHLKKINDLIKALNETNSDITKMSESKDTPYRNYAKNSSGLLKEIEVSNDIIRKE
jgi:hypothetical protein